MAFKVPDYHAHEEFQNRQQKLAKIKELGVDPFPSKYSPTDRASPLEKQYEGQPVGNSEAAQEGKTPFASLAGRLVLFRAMGKNAFAHIQDSTGRLQVMFNRDTTQVDQYLPKEDLTPIKFIEKLIDLGDIIAVEGHLFRTQRGELTLFVTKLTLLCKTLLPLPDKHSGLADKEVRYRKRWLDLISHPEVGEVFKRRSQILHIIRRLLQAQGFMEVETPVLQTVYGGAAAKPFETHLHALEQEMFLRISLEPSLKKLIVGGMEKIFEIGKVFRNEGIDRNHNPEFTMLEAYATYWDYHDLMVFIETLCQTIALELYGTTQVACATTENGEPLLIDFKAPWKRMTMVESIRTYAQIDVDALSTPQLLATVRQRTSLDPSEVSHASRGLLIAFLFEELVEQHLIQPHHITDHPLETTPLCKLHRDPALRKIGVIERFESFVNCHELCNAYSELNDPLLQRTLLEEQAAKRESGNEEACPLDEEFIEAICQGMPPVGGIGIGIDRLIMLLTHQHSIRDVLYFPLMRKTEN
jgi:lysyl-tRNA synthetase class 2